MKRLSSPSSSEVTYVVLNPPTATASDKRRAPRWRTRLRAGRIIDGRSAVLTEIQVRDRSTRGARLRLAKALTLPKQIRFLDDISHQMFDATVAWQRGDEVGILFLREVDARRLTLAERNRLGLQLPSDEDA